MNSPQRLGVPIVDDQEMTGSVRRSSLPGDEGQVPGEALGGQGLAAAARLKPASVLPAGCVGTPFHTLTVHGALRKAARAAPRGARPERGAMTKHA